MELKEFLAHVKRWISLVIIVTACSILIAVLISCFLIKTVYESTTTIMIRNPKSVSDSGIIAYVNDPLNVSSLKAYCTLLQSDLILDRTINDLKINTNINKLRDLIKVNIIPDTAFIKITVGNTQPQLAQEIADILVKNLELEAANINLDNEVIVIDSAKLPIDPARPNLYLNILIAAIAGIMLGISLAIFIENINDTVKSLNIVIKEVRLPFIVAVPKFHKCLSYRLIQSKNEAYKIFRTKVDFLCSINDNKVLFVTSPSFAEGKTITAVNLAVSLGQMGKKVLLIDCNMRKPNLHAIFSIKSQKGLTWALSRPTLLYDIRTTCEKNLDIFVCGQKPDNPTELLASPELSAIIEFGRSNYHMVIIDGPSVIPFADAFIISRLVDAAILVVNYRKTTFRSIEAALENLNDTNILGIVVNRMFPTNKYK